MQVLEIHVGERVIYIPAKDIPTALDSYEISGLGHPSLSLRHVRIVRGEISCLCADCCEHLIGWTFWTTLN